MILAAIAIIAIAAALSGKSGENSRLVKFKSVDGIMLEAETADAFQLMINSAKSQGVMLRVVSGLRSTEKQQKLYNDAVAKYGENAQKYVAKPGNSQHETGKAADLEIDGILPGSENLSAILKSTGFSWLQKNANRFGLRWYNRQIEPWHLERP